MSNTAIGIWYLENVERTFLSGILLGLTAFDLSGRHFRGGFFLVPHLSASLSVGACNSLLPSEDVYLLPIYLFYPSVAQYPLLRLQFHLYSHELETKK